MDASGKAIEGRAGAAPGTAQTGTGLTGRARGPSPAVRGLAGAQIPGGPELEPNSHVQGSSWQGYRTAWQYLFSGGWQEVAVWHHSCHIMWSVCQVDLGPWSFELWGPCNTDYSV